ncbi:MAG: pyruvate formate lyase activating enzyme [Campylobacterota bacterium]|nr:pyruvate formate lyase activating enzyme [Campylobacterota bacterium]
MKYKAWLSKKIEKTGKILCEACHQACVLSEGEYGTCGVRFVENGELILSVYGKVAALHIDPIEKKPLFHFLPNSKSLSLGTVGCNFSCKFCQNASISQYPKERNHNIFGDDLMPNDIVNLALEYKTKSISYTYNEPAVFFEYAYDTAKLAHEKGLKNIFVTSGYETHKAIDTMGSYLDAMNIDIKAFSDDFYKNISGAKLKPVLDTVEYSYKKGIWVEITTLIIPTLNDSSEELEKIANFIASISLDMPWHISAFHPQYKMLDIPRTPHSTLIKAYEIGKKAGLNYVYIGNVLDEDRSSTYCPNCKKKIIDRSGYIGEIVQNHLIESKCPYCQTKIAGVL